MNQLLIPSTIVTRSKALSISCFKVSALDTKIPHNKLITVFNELVDFCFKGVDKK